MRRWIAASIGLATAGCTPGAPPMRSATGLAQGTTYSLQWTGGADEREIADAADRELARIDALLSTYRPDSTLERFNATRSTEALELPAELDRHWLAANLERLAWQNGKLTARVRA